MLCGSTPLPVVAALTWVAGAAGAAGYPAEIAGEASGQSQVVASVITTGAAETVYDWQSEHCADGSAKNHNVPPTPYRRDVPDAPAMAWRDPVTNSTFVAPGDSRGTWPSVGPDLSSVRHDCDLMIFNYSGPTGWEQPAADFSSHEWLYAPFVVPPAAGSGGNATVFMLVHNEFHGWEHRTEGLCNASTMVHGRCWYNAVTLSVSHDGGRSLRHVAHPPAHLVSASGRRYVANRSMYGVFSPSQIVTNPADGYHYSYPVCVSYDGSLRGVCSMRTKTPGIPRSWRYSTDLGAGGAGYIGVWGDPYNASDPQSSAPPAILQFGPGAADLSQPVPRYLPRLGLFIMVGYLNFVKPLPFSPHHFGISTAKQPWGPWSAQVPIPADVNPKRDEPVNAWRGIYPSILDPNSPSLNYDTLESLDVWVYWVQGRNKTVVAAPDMARDLVRQPIRLILDDA